MNIRKISRLILKKLSSAKVTLESRHTLKVEYKGVYLIGKIRLGGGDTRFIFDFVEQQNTSSSKRREGFPIRKVMFAALSPLIGQTITSGTASQHLNEHKSYRKRISIFLPTGFNIRSVRDLRGPSLLPGVY